MMRLIKRQRMAVLLAVLTVFIAGCGIRDGESWPDAQVIDTITGEPNILVAYNNYIDLVDLNGNSVFLRDEEGNIRLDDEGDRRRWQILESDVEGDTGFYVAPFFVDEETLIVPDYNNRLLIYDATSEYVRQRDGRGGVVDLTGHIWAAPVTYTLDDGERLLIVPISERDVVAYNMDEDFLEYWTLPTDRGVWASPLIIGDQLYVPGMDHFLYVVDAATGFEDYRVDLGGAIGATPYQPAGEDAIYVGVITREFFRVDIGGNVEDPQDRITARYETEGWLWGTPAYEDGIFYFGDMNGYVYALELNEAGDGFNELWKVNASGSGIRPTPIVTEEHVVIVSRGGGVYWLDKDNGDEFISYNLDTELLADPILVPGSGTEGGRPPLIVVPTASSGKVLNPFTVDGERYTWVYGR